VEGLARASASSSQDDSVAETSPTSIFKRQWECCGSYWRPTIAQANAVEIHPELQAR